MARDAGIDVIDSCATLAIYTAKLLSGQHDTRKSLEAFELIEPGRRISSLLTNAQLGFASASQLFPFFVVATGYPGSWLRLDRRY